ncbi:diguanylate cyclase [Stigmatella sp. ncwal1]|uniref:diguanylate cyclase n=1 Tax=Stigmatella ashevillensis TaxID=2995309 RepID=A0ABT5D6Y0_9BACT|nr:diguanylate cyclase [Stigmatella ashevillena]MDC0709425.1 diguanylate cyclase [Stigmatella ashevillena]
MPRQQFDGGTVGEKPFALLVVDDSRSTAAKLVKTLTPEGFTLRVVPPGPEAPRLSAEVDLVILCLDPETPADLSLVRRFMDVEGPGRGAPVLVVAPQEARATRLEALRLGVEVVADPWDTDELRARIHRCFSNHHTLSTLAAQVMELQQLSVLDGLTQLHNHRYFQERLREEFRCAQRYDDALCLILLDLDFFKEINDRHGHPVGDTVLCEVARILQQSVRETDIVARYGGEEFAVLLPRTHLVGAITVAERVWKGVSSQPMGPERALHITASLGVSGFPHRTVLTPEQLLLTADEALYRAKREGRNRVCLHSPIPLHSASRGWESKGVGGK